MTSRPDASTPDRKHLLIASCCILALGWGGAPAGAQEPSPRLQKSEIVRLLVEGTWTQGEMAARIRRQCLGFRPTPRDTEHFRSLGAGAEVIRAVLECGERAASRPEGSSPERVAPPERAEPTPRAAEPTPRAASTPREGGSRARAAPASRERPAPRSVRPAVSSDTSGEASLSLSSRRLPAAPGAETEVVAEATAGGDPIRGLYLVLQEAGEVRAADRTDARGRATFRVASGASPGEVRRFVVSSPGRPLVGDSLIEVEAVVAARPDDRPDAVAPLFEPASRRVGGARGGVRGTLDSLREATLALRVVQARQAARQGELERAEGYLAEVEAMAPGRRDVRTLRAYLTLWAGDVEEGVRRFRELVAEDPDDAEAWRGLADALFRSGREEEAREADRRAREAPPR